MDTKKSPFHAESFQTQIKYHHFRCLKSSCFVIVRSMKLISDCEVFTVQTNISGSIAFKSIMKVSNRPRSPGTQPPTPVHISSFSVSVCVGVGPVFTILGVLRGRLLSMIWSNLCTLLFSNH